jgi:hypothetical protein
LPEIDFSHSNPMWRYYSLTEDERAEAGLDGLAAYLPDDSGTANRDVGAYQGGLMRFGAKHNDIFPIISDMLRWAAKLPSRREPTRSFDLSAFDDFGVTSPAATKG